MKVDRLTSAILDFPSGQSTFTCSTQLVPYQRSHFLGTRGRIEIEIPFNAPNDRLCRILIDDGRDVFGSGIATQDFPICDQYTIQGVSTAAKNWSTLAVNCGPVGWLRSVVAS